MRVAVAFAVGADDMMVPKLGQTHWGRRRWANGLLRHPYNSFSFSATEMQKGSVDVVTRDAERQVKHHVERSDAQVEKLKKKAEERRGRGEVRAHVGRRGDEGEREDEAGDNCCVGEDSRCGFDCVRVLFNKISNVHAIVGEVLTNIIKFARLEAVWV